MKRAEFDYHSHGSLMDKENWLIRENDVLKARLKDPDEWGALLWGEFIDPTTKCLGSHEGCDANFSNKEELEKHILQCSIVEEWEWSYGWEHDANYCPGDGKRFPDCDGYYSNKKEGRERLKKHILQCDVAKGIAEYFVSERAGTLKADGFLGVIDEDSDDDTDYPSSDSGQRYDGRGQENSWRNEFLNEDDDDYIPEGDNDCPPEEPPEYPPYDDVPDA